MKQPAAEMMFLKAPLSLTLIFLLLSGCSQIDYSGKIYQPPADRLHYIELDCMYRTQDRGCAGAVKLSGIPNNGQPDKKLDNGIWWIEEDENGEPTVKIQWDDGGISYISGDQFSISETDDFYE